MVELADQLLQKSFLLLPVPIGLLDRAASASDGAEGPAGLIGAEIGRLRIGMLLDLQRKASNWHTIGVILMGIIITVALVDFTSSKLRERLA